jgi:hypothetical protein
VAWVFIVMLVLANAAAWKLLLLKRSGVSSEAAGPPTAMLTSPSSLRSFVVPTHRRPRLRAPIHAVVAAVALLSAGCHLVFPFEAGTPDGPGDAATPEGGPVDSSSDDASGDGPRGDGWPGDVSNPDDATSGDSAALGDGGAPDAGAPDAGALGACVAGTQPIGVSWAPTMTICELGTGSIDQCKAASLCRPGWHLCTASDYKTNGGITNGITGKYWLAACVRQNGVISAPKDVVCGTTCSLVSAVADPVEWACKGTGTLSWGNANVGVVTNSVCRHLGVDVKANAAFWSSRSLTSSGAGAMCCK